MKNLTVADVMTTSVLRTRPTAPLKEIARVMGAHRVSALPVLDADDRLAGIVSERDLLLKQGHQLPTRPHWYAGRRIRDDLRRAAGDTAGAVMTTDVVTIAPAAPLAEAARRMVDHGVKRLPVVDDGGALVGIVSRADLLQAYLRDDEQIRADIRDEVFVRVLWADPTTVEITVRDGIVQLAGTVEERSTAELAERLSRRVDGVVDVVSKLEYRVDDGGVGPA